MRRETVCALLRVLRKHGADEDLHPHYGVALMHNNEHAPWLLQVDLAPWLSALVRAWPYRHDGATIAIPEEVDALLTGYGRAGIEAILALAPTRAADLFLQLRGVVRDGDE